MSSNLIDHLFEGTMKTVRNMDGDPLATALQVLSEEALAETELGTLFEELDAVLVDDPDAVLVEGDEDSDSDPEDEDEDDLDESTLQSRGVAKRKAK